MMTSFVYALMCLAITANEAKLESLTEDQAFAILIDNKARWDASTRTLTITGAGDFTRDHLRMLRSVPIVRTLHIRYTLCDDDLVCLRELGQLHKLMLTGRQFTDMAIVHVAAMPSLTELELEGCRLTAKGVGSLAEIEHLKSLSIDVKSLSRPAILKLKSLPSLRVLTIRHTSSVAGLSGCTQLRVLRLDAVDRTSLTIDELVDQLGDLKQLERLSLSVIEKEVLPLSAGNWFAPEFGAGRFVATARYPLYDQLTTALPDTEVSIEFERKTMTFRRRGGHGTLTFR
ncbi:MAG: hypothetical protein H8E44_33275 [Planctomycetes bacterium]|nr:hypothetical protein [Planctomycetota bacterium]MBL7038189.1 hypothetical protein [Pirellulaceae bacterium]